MPKYDLLKGADPELMLTDSQGNLKSAIDVVLGSVKNPIYVGANSFYHDNVNLEMTIVPGVGKREVVNNIREAFLVAADMVSPFKLVAQASGNFPPEQLDNPIAKEIGCSPEITAYELVELKKPEAAFETSTFRSAGGHVHLGCSAESGSSLRDFYKIVFVVRSLDLFLGVPALFMDHDPTSPKRKELYGSAGSFREKDYGVEYRALGNFWLASPSLVEIVHDLCEFTVDFVDRNLHTQFWTFDSKKLDRGEVFRDCITPTGIDETGLRQCLDKADKDLARPFLDLVERLIPRDLFSAISEKFKPVQYNLYREWGL